MRLKRLLAPCDPEYGFPVLYHITSRVVEKRFIFDDRERARFLRLAKDFAAFSGFELVSWCLMSNHFHLLVRVPVQDVEGISDEEMVERLRHILSAKRLKNVVARLNTSPTVEMRRDVLDSFRKRIGHLPSYVKAVKQEFTQWFNAVNGREGTLWEGRYRSTLIEDTGGETPEATGVGEIARIVARYIDMNPVRAKVEAAPEGSDWSSYGMALRGDPVALRGLRLLWGDLERGHMPGAKGAEGVVVRGSEDVRSAKTGLDHVGIHRKWLLAREAVADLPPDAEGNAVAEGADQTAAATHPRGRPRVLTALSKRRLLGSREFRSRFGIAAVGLLE